MASIGHLYKRMYSIGKTKNEQLYILTIFHLQWYVAFNFLKRSLNKNNCIKIPDNQTKTGICMIYYNWLIITRYIFNAMQSFDYSIHVKIITILKNEGKTETKENLSVSFCCKLIKPNTEADFHFYIILYWLFCPAELKLSTAIME